MKKNWQVSALMLAQLLGLICFKFWADTANASDLFFLLKPVAAYLGFFFDTEVTPLSNGEFLLFEQIYIDKSCSGKLFLFIFSASLLWILLYFHRFFSVKKYLLYGFLSLFYAYFCTLFANIARIVGAIFLLQNQKKMTSFELSSESLHLLEGTFVYLLYLIIGLFLFYLFLKKKFSEKRT